MRYERVLGIIATLSVFAVMFLSAAPYSDGDPPDGPEYDILEDGSAAVTGFSGEPTSIIIPTNVTIDGVDRVVSTIASYAFDGCWSLTSVVLPDSIVTIERYAFRDCSSLESIDLGDGADRILEYAFLDCISLTSVDLAGTVALDPNSFSGCESLSKVTVGKELVSMPANAFDGCEVLTEMYIHPENPMYTLADGMVFSKDLRAVILCLADERVTFIIPEGVETVGIHAFTIMPHVTHLFLPDSLVTIEECAFKNVMMESVTFGDGLTTIYDGAFLECEHLFEVTIPDSVTFIGVEAFSGCVSLEDVVFGDGLTEMPYPIFPWCSSLVEVDIPATLITIAKDSFDGCTGLRSIDVDADNPAYCDVDGVLFTKDMSTLIIYPQGAPSTYSVPEGVMAIGDEAFYACELTRVTIPSSVTSIGDNAFNSIYTLYEVTLSEGLVEIGDQAFGSTGLFTVKLPSTLRTIGSGAFDSCYLLADVYIPEDVSMGAGAFHGVCGVDDDMNPTPGTTVGHHYDGLFCSNCGMLDLNQIGTILIMMGAIALIGVLIIVFLVHRSRKRSHP